MIIEYDDPTPQFVCSSLSKRETNSDHDDNHTYTSSRNLWRTYKIIFEVVGSRNENEMDFFENFVLIARCASLFLHRRQHQQNVKNSVFPQLSMQN